ncbi:GTPase Era [Mycoplasmopsis agassizii]|uniref:GTPase Era n=1 Tax=Mycoplasmopsis agassizii TaxID=33922 RepID=A0ABX4H5X8_9BACT|nr:GTPase Era [Mycoplasmopsis agassizii]PAF55280.1 GTPase Era [Mycoplasmopsis agassizii]SMC15698.1 GTP-binding protein Era [Mycoplasmopsis agassizii]
MKILFVSIVGRPNVGKSTLLNQILDYDLAIVNKKPQATRNVITGILNTEDNYQIIFSDTPGIHKPISKYGDNLNKEALNSLKEIDLAAFLTPANEEISTGDIFIIDHLKNTKNKIAIITKVDLENKTEILKAKADKLRELGFKDIFAISKKDNTSITKLIDVLKSFAYEGEQQYDSEIFTDINQRFMAKEIIREVAMNHLDQELPYSILVDIDQFSETDNEFGDQSFIEIRSTIYVNKESQKGIVIGKNGKLIKLIGEEARKAISERFSVKTKLFLNVKVKKNWVNNEEFINKMGL